MELTFILKSITILVFLSLTLSLMIQFIRVKVPIFFLLITPIVVVLLFILLPLLIIAITYFKLTPFIEELASKTNKKEIKLPFILKLKFAIKFTSLYYSLIPVVSYEFAKFLRELKYVDTVKENEQIIEENHNNITIILNEGKSTDTVYPSKGLSAFILFIQKITDLFKDDNHKPHLKYL